jgi:peptidyl-prolyl cis-trans isomerase D
MSVLENLRKGTDSTSTRLLIGLVVAVFIFWGVGRNRNPQTSIYALVNGVAITDSDFRRSFNLAARQSQHNLSDEEEQQLGTQVLTSLIQEEALVQEADRLGVSVSEEEVAREVVKIPSFAGEDGKFSEKIYEKALKANGMSKGHFEIEIRRQLLVTKLEDLAKRSVNVTEAEVKDAWAKQETSLDLTFIRLPPEAFLADIPISDADRDTFVTQNADRIKSRYDEQFDRFYNLPKRYQLRTILLRTDIAGVDEAAVKARADAVRAEAAAGADFATLARRWSEDLSASNGGNLGLLAQAQIDPAVVAAADGAGVGKLSEVTKTSRGFQVLLVEKIEDAKVISLEEAKPEIAVAMLREERAPAVIDAFAGQLVQAWKDGGAPPAALAEPKHLVVDTTGPFALGDAEIPRLGDSAELRAAIASAPTGYVVPVPMKLKGTVFVIGVGSRTDADPSTYDNVRPMIEGRLLAERRGAFLEQWRADVVAHATVKREAKL